MLDVVMQVGFLQKGKKKVALQKNKTRSGGKEWKNKGTYNQG